MGPLILIVDDDQKSRKLLTDVLRAEGYSTVTADNGQRAIELARSDKPELILMDVQMPVLNGLSAVRVLKTDPDTLSIPVVMITAQAMRDDRERLLEAGGDGYLSKPIAVKELRAVVNRYLACPHRGTQEEVADDLADTAPIPGRPHLFGDEPPPLSPVPAQLVKT